jgi:hypothetical protein
MKRATIYLFDAEHEDGGSFAAPTLADAMEFAREEARMGHDSTIYRVRAAGLDLRRLLCAVHNHSGFVETREEVGTWMAGESIRPIGEDPYGQSGYHTEWHPAE